MVSRAIFFIGVVLIACGPTPHDPSLFEAGRELGINTNEKLEEASGLAASTRYPGYVWSHNDSGHPADLFLLDSVGKTIATFRLEGATNRDWEDIALGPGPDSTNYIYVGDIGDNHSRQVFKTIYCVEEPSLDHIGPLPVKAVLIIRMIDQPRDTEALLADPISRNLYLVTKTEKQVWLYEVKSPFGKDTVTAERIIELPLRHIVAGDISRDGSEILLKSYDGIYYWRRSEGQSIPDALKSLPIELAYKREPQGEAIAWAINASGFYTLSENAKGERAKLFFYERKVHVDSAAPDLNRGQKP